MSLVYLAGTPDIEAMLDTTIEVITWCFFPHIRGSWEPSNCNDFYTSEVVED